MPTCEIGKIAIYIYNLARKHSYWCVSTSNHNCI